jgi:hypothetical protein
MKFFPLPQVPTVNNSQSSANNNSNNNNNNNSSKGGNMQSATLPRTNAAGQLQIANSNQQQQQQQQAGQQNSGTWTYYPDQQGKNNSYYHLPAHARHSYHGEAIYQNCHTMTVQQTQQAIIPGHVHQKLAQQQPHAAAIHAIQHAQQINRFSHFARSPTRRPESPPPLRNYHQTMVLIPYKSANGNGTYAAYGIASEGGENNIYQRQHNIVEYQQVNECKSMVGNPDLQIFDEMQVTQQTIRIPIGGYPMPGMQLHVVNAAASQRAPHYATLPRQNSAQGANSQTNVGNAFIYPDKPMESRGVPEGEAAVQQSDCTNNIIATCQDGESNNNQPGGTVYYAMNV